MLRTSRRRLVLLSLACIAATVVAACSAHTSTPLTKRQRSVQASDTNVKFKDCAQQCTGTIDGAAYTIKLPKQWNGTLLLWSHGYRQATPWPPDFAPVVTTPEASAGDTDGSGSDPVSQQLLGQGYALAGSAYKSNGWAVADGVKADEDLHTKFVQAVGTPKRTYVWGGSLGGLITEVVSEQNPSWVDGAAPICGVLGGPNLNLDLALDVAYAIKALIDPQLKLTGYTSAADATKNWEHAAAAMQKAAADISGGGTAKALLVAALADAPDKTKTYDGHDLVSQVKARVESALTALAYGTNGRYEIEQRVGGNPSDNTKADYASRISPDEASLITQAGGSVGSLVAKLDSVPRVSADPAARDAFAKLGNTTGDLTVPTLTMHTEDDPLVLVQNERVFAGRVQAHNDNGKLVQLYIAPPATYDETTGAAYGAGHCNFSDKQLLGVVSVLDNWVRKGVYPIPAGVAGQLGEGVDPAYVPAPWPDASAS
jgi:pimeloyl-ACP methyl ester carboxylesterase